MVASWKLRPAKNSGPPDAAGIRTKLLREALPGRGDGFRGTDDAQLVERLGHAVEIVDGDPSNLKITWPADLAWAEACVAQRREEDAT
jgi:2-C-methyl-D-erythritol 4-phosphate cytidylyltransferase